MSGAWPADPAFLTRLRAAPRPAFLGAAEAGLALGCLLLFSQGLIGPLFADPADPDASVVLRLIWLPVYALTMMLVLLRPGAVLQTASRNLLLVGLIGLAGLSTLWSIDGDQTLRRSFALAMTTLFGLWMAARWRWPDLLGLFAACFAFLALASVAMALAMPSLGIDQDVHAGAWKGVWWEKNTLGAMMATGAVACCAAAIARPKEQVFWFGFAALCGALVFLSTSKTALLAWALGLSGMAGVAVARRGFGFAALMIFSLAMALIGATLILLLAPLEALELLGRDATLTGRTDIWVVLADAVSARPWTGYGYSAFWSVDDGPVFWVRQATAWPVPTAHNGWIEIALAVGLPGVALAMLVYLRGLLSALGRMFAGVEVFWALPYLAIFGLISISESNWLQQNGLSWVLVTATMAKLALRTR